MRRTLDIPRRRNARPTSPTGKTRRLALRPLLALVLVVAAGGCVNVRLNPSLGKGSPARHRAILAARR